MTAMRVVQEQTGIEKMHTVGYCVAGTLLGATLAYMAAKDDDRVLSATFFTSQMDFEFAGDLLFFTDDAGIKYVEAKMDEAGGVLEGQVMSETFNALRALEPSWQARTWKPSWLNQLVSSSQSSWSSSISNSSLMTHSI